MQTKTKYSGQVPKISEAGRRGVLLTTALTLALSALAACGEGGSSDADSKTIVVGANAPVTGLIAGAMPVWHAADAYFQSANDAGGINGYTFKYVIADDQADPSLAVGVARKLVTQDHVIAIVNTSSGTTTAAINGYLEQNKVPALAQSGSPDVSTDYTYLVLPDSVNLAGFEFTYATQNLADGGKVALAFQNDAVGQPFETGVDAAAEELGLDDVPKVSFQVNTTDFAPMAAKLKASGATAVVVGSSVPPFVPLIRAADAIGYHPAWLGQNYHGASAIMEGVPAAAAGSVYFAEPFALTDSDDTADMRDALAKYYPDTPPSSLTVQGWAAASMFGEAVKRLTDQGKKPSSETVAEALNSFQEFSNGYISNVTYDPDTGVEKPHVPRPDVAIAKWDPEDQAVEAETDFESVPLIPGQPGQ